MTRGLLDTVAVGAVSQCASAFVEAIVAQHPELLKQIAEKKEFDEAWETSLKQAFADFLATAPEAWLVRTA